MNSIKVKMLAALAVSGLAGAGFLISTPAFAGTNGQTVRVCMQNVSYTKVTLRGTNQHGQEIDTGALPFFAGCPTIENFSWKGLLSITMAESTVATEQPYTQTCDVPESQSEDFFVCTMKLPDVAPPADVIPPAPVPPPTFTPPVVFTVIKFKNSGFYLAEGCLGGIVMGDDEGPCTPAIARGTDQTLTFLAQAGTPYWVSGNVAVGKGSSSHERTVDADKAELCFKFTGSLFNGKFREVGCDDF